MTAPSVRTSALPLFTVSRAKAARSCRRLHKLRYLDGYKPAVESEDTRFGTLWHLGQEAWWRAPHGHRLDPALDALRAVPNTDPFDLAKAEVLLIGYDARWGDEPYEVLAVEVEFLGPLLNPRTGIESRNWRRAGKIDVIVRDLRDGLVRVGEHKTSSEDIRQGSEYWRRLRIDSQVSGYFEGGRLLGHDIAGCLYDVVLKPAQRPGNVPLLDEQGSKIVHDAAGARVRTKDGKKWRETADTAQGYVLQTRPETVQEYRNRIAKVVSEDPAAYFQRGEVSRLEAELDEAMLDDWHLAQELRDSIRLGRFPRNPGACTQWGKTCQFFDACTGAASLDDPTRFVRSVPHPELSVTGPDGNGASGLQGDAALVAPESAAVSGASVFSSEETA